MSQNTQYKLMAIIILLVLGAAYVWPISAKAAEPRIVRVACGMNDALYLDETGNPAGIMLPYLRQLSWTNNWTYEYVEGSYAEGIENLKSGKVDIMAPVGKDDDPDGQFAFADIVAGYQQIALFARDDADIYYNDTKAMDGKQVGLSIGANSVLLDNYAKAHGFSYVPVALNTINDKITALKEGRVDLIAFSTLNTVPDAKVVAILDQVPFYFCTRANDQQLMAELKAGMADAMTQSPEIVSTLYQEALGGSTPVAYTREEHETIDKAGTVRVGLYGDRLPLSGRDADGNLVGIYVDVLKEISELSGLDIQPVAVEDSNALYKNLDDGTVDFVIGPQILRFTSPGAENYLASNGIGTATDVTITQANYALDKNEEPRFALVSDQTNLKEDIIEQFPKAEIAYHDTRRDCLDAVVAGRANATIMDNWEWSYESKNSRYQSLKRWDGLQVNSVFSLGALNTANLPLLSILEKTNGQIPKDTLSNIIAHNTNRDYCTYTAWDRVYQWRTALLATLGIVLTVLIALGIYIRMKKQVVDGLVLANQAKSEFLSRMSHELRTPLAAIIGYAELTGDAAKRNVLNASAVEKNMDAIRHAANIQLGLVGDILDIQDWEAGNLTLESTTIDLTECLKGVLDVVRPKAEAKRQTLNADLQAVTQRQAVLDGTHYQQVLVRLLDNAVKFTPDGGTITLATSLTEVEGESSVIAVVSDTGIGMADAFIENQLFGSFIQEDSSIRSPYTGCGTGLAIAKRLVDAMGGRLECTSKLGEGTTFTLTMPTTITKHKRRRANTPIANFNGLRVLVCEDNQINQDIESRLLTRLGCVVDVASDGQAGVDLFTSSDIGTYGLIIMDIRMPKMDGLDATRAIRATDRSDATLPIVALSANAASEDVAASLSAGMNEHLAKPADGRVLIRVIEQWCM